MNSCRNCKEPINDNWDYCPICGRPEKLKRIDKHYIIQELGGFFFANKGMVYTIKNVLIRPGESVRQFIAEDRYRFVKPITFLFITTFIYAVVNQIFGISFEDYLPQPDVKNEVPTSTFIMSWLIANPGYFSIIMIIFIAFWIKKIFKKAGYNFFEIFILCCFVSGITTLYDSIIAIIKGVTQLKLQISMSIGVIYTIWAIGQFFDKKKASSYIKAFFSYMLGMLLLMFIAAVGGIIEVVIRLK